MAFFKINRGKRINLPSSMIDGQVYFCTDTGEVFVDYLEDGVLKRKQANESLIATIDDIVDTKADVEHTHDIADLTEDSTHRTVTDAEKASWNAKSDFSGSYNDLTDQPTIPSIAGLATEDYVDNAVSVNYDESIIGLSIDGQVITYIKGDGSQHTLVTQDTDTTYSLATDETTGLTKLYATTGSAEDGTMTQKAIKTELDKKVGVSIDETQDTLVFTI